MIIKKLLKTTPRTLFVLTLLVAITIPLLSRAYAETLESPNYRIDGATIGADSDISDSSSGNFTMYSTIGQFSGNPRSTSTSYELREGDPDVFQADTPEVACFETVSSGSSNCTTASSYVNTYGMVRVCGATGCYGQARIEIDETDNPSDTLYGVQISTDDFASDIQVVDGSSRRLKDFADRELADYLTKTSWESTDKNIWGLQSNTQYWVRIVALHGDFTESSHSPTANATTANAILNFDLDITDDAETTPETGSPYSIAFSGSTQLIAGSGAVTSSNLIWMDLDTNASGGAAIVQKGEYGGLYSSNETFTITSATANLGTATDGFGLQNFDWSTTETYQEDYSGSGGSNLGEISVESNYNSSDDNVGQIDTSHTRVFDADGPIDDGRTALKLIAKAGLSTPPETDYTETITIVAVGRYGGPL